MIRREQVPCPWGLQAEHPGYDKPEFCAEPSPGVGWGPWSPFSPDAAVPGLMGRGMGWLVDFLRLVCGGLERSSEAWKGSGSRNQKPGQVERA